MENYQEEILALIARSVAGLTEPSEEEKLRQWIEKSYENNNFFEQVKNIWDASDRESELINTPLAFEKVLHRVHKASSKKSFWFYWQRIAAVLLIPLFISVLLLLYFRPANPDRTDAVFNEVFAARGTRSSFRLSDSTLIWLNSGSSLKYPVKFTGDNRIVSLKGEAYFEVESDVSRPFIVQTPTLQVKATGTKFRVQEFDLNPISEVTLVSGEVSISESDNKNSKVIAKLIPDQNLIYNRQTGEHLTSNEDTYRFIAWKDGKLIFRNERLEKVLNTLSLIYNVDIEIKGDNLKNYKYHATFQEESLEEILKLLRLSAPITFKEEVRYPLPDGSFPKKKIIIYSKNQQLN